MIVDRIKKGDLKFPSSTMKFPHMTERTLLQNSLNAKFNGLSTAAVQPTSHKDKQSHHSVTISSLRNLGTEKYFSYTPLSSGNTSYYVNNVTGRKNSQIAVDSTFSSTKNENSMNKTDSVIYTSTPTTNRLQQSVTYRNQNSDQQQTLINSEVTLSSTLKKHGLFAMAKYLRQSGLDSVLNQTGK